MKLGYDKGVASGAGADIGLFGGDDVVEAGDDNDYIPDVTTAQRAWDPWTSQD